MGPEYFPSRSFWGCGIILQLRLSEIAYTCMRLRWPTTVKIDSDGIWWLTHSLGPERGKNGRGGKINIGERKKKAQGLTHVQQLHARVSTDASAIRKTAWIGGGGLEHIHSVRLWPKHTRLRKADTCTLPPIILFTSLCDLRATGPLPRKQEELGQTGGWQLSEGPPCGDICHVLRPKARERGSLRLATTLFPRRGSPRCQSGFFLLSASSSREGGNRRRCHSKLITDL